MDNHQFNPVVIIDVVDPAFTINISNTNKSPKTDVCKVCVLAEVKAYIVAWELREGKLPNVP